MDELQPENRVIDGNEVKTYHVSTTMMILDDKVPGDRLEGCEIYAENPVPVLTEDGKTLGFAAVYTDGKELVADLFLDYYTPERLDIENGAGPELYAYPTMLTAMDSSDGVWRTASATIVEVLLIPRKPYDDRLEPI